MRRLTATFAAALTLAACGFAGMPPATADPSQPSGALAVPDGPAQTWLLADLDSGRILASRNPYQANAPASTIKVLLAIVVLDQVNLNSAIVAGPNSQVECSCAGIKAGRAYTARQLLDGLLLVSGNDAANTLADMLGGLPAAVAKMNAKAYQVGARHTRVGSPSGLDDGVDMFTTPHDLAVIFRAALAYPMFAHIIRQPSATFPNGAGTKVLVNQDQLLKSYPGAMGGKTGYTNKARKTYVGAAQRNGKRLVVVQMYGSDSSGMTYWDQARGLLDWGFSQ